MSVSEINTKRISPRVVERQRAFLDEDRDCHEQPGHSDDPSELEAEVYIGEVSARRLRRVLKVERTDRRTPTAKGKKGAAYIRLGGEPCTTVPGAVVCTNQHSLHVPR